MTQARASHLRLVVNEPAPITVRQPRLRFHPVVRLADGSAFGMHTEADIAFEDTFQTRHLTDAVHPSAAAWLGDLIERAARLAKDTGADLRPLSVSAPMAALADKDAPMAAEAGVLRAGLLPQEIRIDFCDASVSALEDLALDRVDAFRRRGFRVGLDARKSWNTPMGARARMTFEAVRLVPSRCEALEVPMTRLEVASADGIALIAENVRWRDTDKLAELGVHFAMAPKADS
jgi:hypothetical protein